MNIHTSHLSLPVSLRPLVLAALAALLVGVLALHGPIPQWASYHAFADGRSLFGIPNAGDVLSNLPFAFVGLWALWTGRDAARGTAAAWNVFAVALVATAAGSAWYHLAPANAALVLDRLPIAWACAALTSAFLAERVDERWAAPGTLGAALVLASASVAAWWWSELAGASDLRAYLALQFLPMLLVPAGLLLRLPRRGLHAVPDAGWWAVLAGYAVAKVFELADHAVFEHAAWISGHTLKHLAAAAAAFALLASRRRVQLR